jgi:hypothetical protein
MVHRDSKGSLQTDDRLTDGWSGRESSALTALAYPHGTYG